MNKEYNKIKDRLIKSRNKELRYNLINSIIKASSINLIILILFLSAEAIFYFDTVVREFLFYFSILSMSSVYIAFLFQDISKYLGIKDREKPEETALRIGEFYPEMKDRLSNSIQIITNSADSALYSNDLSIAAFQQAMIEYSDRDFDVIIDKKKNKSFFILFIISLLFSSAIYFPLSGTFNDSFNRIVNYNKSFLPAAPFKLEMNVSAEKLIRGDELSINVKAIGQAPKSINLNTKEENQLEYETIKLKLDSANTYNYKFKSLKNSLEIFASADWLGNDVVSEKKKVIVTDLPFVKSLNGSLVYPKYTKMPAEKFNEQNADLNALKGSNLQLNIVSSKDLSKAFLVYESINESDSLKSIDTSKIEMKIDNKLASVNYKLEKSGTYYFELIDKDENKNEDPIKFKVVISEDLNPTINLTFPVTHVKLNEESILPLKFVINDDYGFSDLKLYYKLIESAYTVPEGMYKTIDIEYADDKYDEITYIWDLNKLGISPEDVYEFYIQVWDNDNLYGPKTAYTPILTARLPSLDEVLNDTEKEQEKISKDLSKLLKETEKISKEMKDLNRELLKDAKKNKVDWKDKKKAEQIKERQKEIQKRMDKIQQNLSDLNKKMQENKTVSKETLEKFMELQKLMQQVNSPELRQMQQRMQEAMKQLTPEQMRKAMEEAKFDEEKFRKSIERSLNLLKRMQAEQKVDALKKRAEELQKLQDELQKQTENTNPNDKNKIDDLARKQDKAKKDLDKIKNELEELDKMMKDLGKDMPRDMLKEAMDKLDADSMMQDMQNSKKNMQSGDMQNSSQQQSGIKQKLSEFADDMQKLKDKMKQKELEEAMRKMQKSTSDMLDLSKKQEQLMNKTQMADYNSTSLSEFAKEQAEYSQAMANIANSLMELAQKTMAVSPNMINEMGDAMQSMEQSIQNLSNRRSSSASKNQGDAMSSMNKAASEMQKMLSHMKKTGSCNNPGGQGQGSPGQGNMSQQLGQMAKQQQAINQAMQQMQSQGGRMSQEQQAQLKRLAKKQGEGGKSLEQMAQEQEKFGQRSKDGQRAKNELREIAKEMQDAMRKMQRGRVDQDLLNKQDRILSKLLDASRALNKRDFEDKREGETAKRYSQDSPDEINFYELNQNEDLQELIRNSKNIYTKDYQNLIKKYFQTLKKNKNQ